MSNEILGEFERAQATAGAFDNARLEAGNVGGELPPPSAPTEAVEPKAVEPKAVEPKAVEPEAVEPKAVEPEALEPEVGTPPELEASMEDAEPPEPGLESEKPDDSPSVAGELAMAIPRGVEGAAEGVWDLLDFVTGDALPDWDRADNSLFGEAQTTTGKVAEGLVQFGVGFIPGLGAASLLGKASKLGKMGKALTASKESLKTFSKGQLSLSPSTMKKMSKLKQYTKTNMRFATAGALSDFTVFKGEEARLTNLLAGREDETSKALYNWLAYQPDQDNNELAERAKRAIEGIIVGEIFGLAFVGVKAGIKGVLPKRAGVIDSASALDIPEGAAAVSATQKILGKFKKKNEVLGEQKAKGEPLDEYKAADDALKDPETQLTLNETKSLKELDQRQRDAVGNREQEELTGTKTSDLPPTKGVEDAENALEGVDAPVIKKIDPKTATEDELDAWLRENADMPGSVSSLETKRGFVKDIIEESQEGGKEHLIKGLQERVIKQAEETGLFEGQNPQSFLGAIKLLHSVPEMRALLSHISKAGLKASKAASKGKKLTPQQQTESFEETLSLMSRADEAAGGNGKIDMEHLRGKAEDLALVRQDAETLYGGINQAVKDLQKSMQDARTAINQTTVEVNIGGKIKTLNEAQAVTEMYSAMDRFTALQEIWGDFGRQMSLNMRQRNDLYITGQSALGRDIPGQHRTLGIAVEDAMSEAGKHFRRQNTRGVSNKRVVKDLEKLFKKSGFGETGGGVELLGKGMKEVGVSSSLSRYILTGRKGLAVSQEWYYNAILGSPTTWAVNALGGALVMPLRHIESIAGGVMTGNIPLVKANFKVMFDIQSFKDSIKYAWKSGVDDEARSVVGYTAYRDDRMVSGRREIQMDNPDGNAVYGAINFIGKLVNHPTRVMMVGDEFFKQLSFRARTKTALAMEGYQKGLHRQPGALAKHIHDGFEGLITKDGRFRNEHNIRREAQNSLIAARKTGENIVDERKFIKNYMDEHLYNNKLTLEDGTIYSAKGFEEREMLVKSGTDWALVNTFTNEVKNGFFKKTGEIATMSPALGFVIPFVRTPSNILLFALGRALPVSAPKQLGAARKALQLSKEVDIDTVAKKFEDMPMPEARKQAEKYMKTMQGESSIEAAEAAGRLSTGLMTMGAMFLSIENILDRVTGSPPEDPGKRAAWEATGKKGFSIRLGDKWHNYQRLDPFATTLGIMADIVHGWEEMRNDGVSEFGDEDEFAEKQNTFFSIAGVLATSFANNVTNKSYLENLGELLDIMEKPSESFEGVMGNIMAGFVPNGLNWSQNVFEEEPAILEARGILDKMKKRLPKSMRPGEKLMPRRNAFGEIMRKSPNNTGDIRQNPLALAKGLNPLFSSDVSNDIVDIEIENHAVGRKPMEDGRNIAGNSVSYKSFRNELGNTAYDRMQELSGSMKLGPRQLTLRQALRATIESFDYQELPPLTEKNRHRDHPRSKKLSKIINIYRSAARRQTGGEFPQLRAALSKLNQ